MELVVRRDSRGLYVRPYLGTDPVTGRKVRPMHRLGATTMADAEREAAEWWAERQGNPPLMSALDAYVGLRAATDAAPATVRTWRTCMAELAPALGRVRVRDLTTSQVGEVYERLLRTGGSRGAGLSRNTVQKVHWFLNGAYKQFMREGICVTNPVQGARRPRPERGEATALDADSLALLQGLLVSEMSGGAEPRRRVVAFAAWLALNTGMRAGEVCALLRRDVRVAQRDVHVCATCVETGQGLVRQEATKGRRSRNVSLDPAGMEVVAAHLAWQAGLLGDVGRDTPVASPDGRLVHPGDLSRSFSAMAREAGLPEGTHFHMLRHTHATWLLARGVDLKTVSERLGHAKPATTLQVYSHVLPGRDALAAAAFREVSEEVGFSPPGGRLDG